MKVANENQNSHQEPSKQLESSGSNSMTPPAFQLKASNGGDEDGKPVQRMKMDAADQKANVKFTKFVKEKIPKKANDKRVIGALNTNGTNTGKTKRDIAADLTWGSGPTINVTPLSGANGEFTPDSKSSEIRIDQGIVTAYENAKTDLEAHELLLESTILHEYTHYLDDQDGVDRAGEEGQAFEEANYGMDIDDVADAQSLLKAEYGPGTWTVSFVNSIAGFSQRVVVSGAAKGNGTYDKTSALSQTITGPKAGKWKIQIQHNDGKNGWKNSKMLNVKEGTDNYLLRSEDWTDSDYDDLEIRVKK